MRKATVFTLTFVFLMLTLTHKADAAKCTVINQSLFRLAVAHASWMKADGKYPEGFRVKGWFYVDPGKQKIFSAQNDIYVRVAPMDSDSRPFTPANATRDAKYSLQVRPLDPTYIKSNSFTTVESSEGQVIYSSTNRTLLVRKDGFYEFTQNGTFKVSGDGRDAGARAWKRKDLADASTYSCTAPSSSFRPTPVPTKQSYTDKQYGDKGKGQAVTNKTVVDIEKAAVTTKDDLWTRAETVSPVDDTVGGPIILTVKFLDKGSEFFSEEKAETIEKIASVWSLFGNIKFKFVESGTADFSIQLEPRIARNNDGKIRRDKHNQPLRVAEYSCHIGTGAKRQVMNLCFTDWENTSYQEKKRVTLHEFGHALGFHHEHKNVNLQIKYNIPDVVAYYEATQGWDAETTKTNVFGALDSSKWNFTEFDPYSIMLYPIQQFQTFNDKEYKLTHNSINFKHNTNLSEIDKAAIRRMYPGRDTPSKRTKSGNGIEYVRFDYSVVGDDIDLFSSRRFSPWRDWTEKFTLPRGTILAIRNVTIRADRGYVKNWTRFGLNKIAVVGRIEDGDFIYGKVDGYLEVVYLP